MTQINKRCGTCRYWEPRAFRDSRYGSRYGYCDWVVNHIVDIKIPYWIKQKKSRPLTFAESKKCDAWEPKPMPEAPE